mmetsp:Transcript_41152/g.102378  ORF Transcript_41152/g.102378 Transcript_41152/m.102378 type:complete len:145 (+) Transcript_41152:462-896(+)
MLLNKFVMAALLSVEIVLSSASSFRATSNSRCRRCNCSSREVWRAGGRHSNSRGQKLKEQLGALLNGVTGGGGTCSLEVLPALHRVFELMNFNGLIGLLPELLRRLPERSFGHFKLGRAGPICLLPEFLRRLNPERSLSACLLA